MINQSIRPNESLSFKDPEGCIGFDVLDAVAVAAGKLGSGPVALWAQGEKWFVMHAVDWKEAASMLRSLEDAPEACADGLQGAVLDRFLGDVDAYNYCEPIPADGLYQAYLGWHARNETAPGPWGPEKFTAGMKRLGYERVVGRFGAVYKEDWSRGG